LNIELTYNSPIQIIDLPIIKKKLVEVYVKRDDLIHNEISGNKWRKLKYNLLQAQSKNLNTILTFGGAYSNHIAATAAASKMFSFKSIGLIRGEESLPLNVTLQQAKSNGMDLFYIERSAYKNKNSYELKQELREQFGNFFMIPEGGANFYGVNGCMEIIDEINQPFDYIVCACGTGTTLAGLVLKLKLGQKAIGVSALKNGGFLKQEVLQLISDFLGDKEAAEEYANKFEIITSYDFGGYAKTTPELIQFMQSFYKVSDIITDPIYTNKMFYGLLNLIEKDYFPKGSNIIAMHTGGLQGIKGFEFAHKIKLYN
jgi:1-aminocyclopropane-1-carboxylate deaminase